MSPESEETPKPPSWADRHFIPLAVTATFFVLILTSTFFILPVSIAWPRLVKWAWENPQPALLVIFLFVLATLALLSVFTYERLYRWWTEE